MNVADKSGLIIVEGFNSVFFGSSRTEVLEKIWQHEKSHVLDCSDLDSYLSHLSEQIETLFGFPPPSTGVDDMFNALLEHGMIEIIAAPR